MTQDKKNLIKLMNPWSIYLRSELGKLQNPKVAETFLEVIGDGLRIDLSLPQEISRLSNLFSSQTFIDLFVSNLTEFQQQELIKKIESGWRKNSIERKICKYRLWTLQTCFLEHLYLRPAEAKVRVIFEKHNYHLTSIATDAELYNYEPYASMNRDREIKFHILLGDYWQGKVRLFDGTHRAIQMVFSNWQYAKVMYPANKNKPLKKSERAYGKVKTRYYS